ncbi:MAG TPA: tetratricopeptide repeat protein [Armatimonadota bacterium]
MTRFDELKGPLHFGLMGPFDVVSAAEREDDREKDAQTIASLRRSEIRWDTLALLSLRAQRPVESDELAKHLGKKPGDRWRALTQLKMALGERRLVRTPESAVTLDLSGDEVDLRRFKDDIARAERGDLSSLAQAVESYRPILLGIRDGWASNARVEAHNRFIVGCGLFVAAMVAEGDCQPALACLQRAAEREWEQWGTETPPPTTANELLVDTLCALHRYSQASRACESAQRRWPKSAKADTITQLASEVDSRRETAERRRNSGRAYLPPGLAGFVGRTSEGLRIQWNMCLDGRRRVTLWGPPGSGKTELAILASNELIPQFEDGVWFVDLSQVGFEDGTGLDLENTVAEEIASAVGIPLALDAPRIDSLREYARTRNLLIVLDNCEHVVAACRTVANALLPCTGLSLLATSRSAVGMRDEVPVYVPGLPLPPDGLWHNLAAFRDTEVVRIFEGAAGKANLLFRIEESDAESVDSICRALDGIPYLTVLAGSLAGTLGSAAEISARWDEWFDMLSPRHRGGRGHQASLDQMLSWSYELLADEPEAQALLRRVSFFASDWTLADAEAVCGDGTSAQSPPDRGAIGSRPIARLLARLVEASLVQQHGTATDGRFRLLSYVREFARRRLRPDHDDTAEAELVRRRHFEHVCHAVEGEYGGAQAARYDSGLERVSRLYPDIRVALAWPKPAEFRLAQVQLVASLSGFWSVRGWLDEGRAQLRSALRQAEGLEGSKPLAKAYNCLGVLAFISHDYREARISYLRALRIARMLSLEGIAASSLGNLGVLADTRGRSRLSRRYHEACLSLRLKIGGAGGIAAALNNLARQESNLGNFDGARTYGVSALEYYREAGDEAGVATASNNLAVYLMRSGDLDGCQALLSDALTRRYNAGDERGVAAVFENLASLAAERRSGYRSAWLFGAADRLRAKIGVPVPDSDLPDQESSVAKAKEATGIQAFAAAFAAGAARPLDEAVRDALTDDA